jgi:hypothetical protein
VKIVVHCLYNDECDLDVLLMNTSEVIDPSLDYVMHPFFCSVSGGI